MGASLGACCLQRCGRAGQGRAGVGRWLGAGSGTRQVLAAARQYKVRPPCTYEGGAQALMASLLLPAHPSLCTPPPPPPPPPTHEAVLLLLAPRRRRPPANPAPLKLLLLRLLPCRPWLPQLRIISLPSLLPRCPGSVQLGSAAPLPAARLAGLLTPAEVEYIVNRDVGEARGFTALWRRDRGATTTPLQERPAIC